MIISLGPCLAHLSEVLGAFRIARAPEGARRSRGRFHGRQLGVPRKAVPIAYMLRAFRGIQQAHGTCSWRHAQKFPCARYRKKPACVKSQSPAYSPAGLPCKPTPAAPAAPSSARKPWRVRSPPCPRRHCKPELTISPHPQRHAIFSIPPSSLSGNRNMMASG